MVAETVEPLLELLITGEEAPLYPEEAGLETMEGEEKLLEPPVVE